MVRPLNPGGGPGAVAVGGDASPATGVAVLLKALAYRRTLRPGPVGPAAAARG